MKSNHVKLFKNTILMYILTFSSYFFSFVSIPYQSRILGPENFGKISFALAFMSYFTIIIDYGFALSTIEDVVRYREDKNKLSEIFSSVNIIKIILFFVTFIFLILITSSFNRFNDDLYLYVVTFLSVNIISFIPDFIYRGIEDIEFITKRTILVRFAFLFLLLFFLKRSEDYILVPIFNLIANVLSLILVFIDLNRRKIKICKVEVKSVLKVFKKSSEYFLSRFASTVYSASNLFIIGLIYPSGNVNIGYYSSVERLISLARSMFAPIADSLFPFMIKNKDYNLIRRLLLILIPFIVFGLWIVYNYAEVIIVFIYGEEFVSSSYILRILIPIVAITPFLYLFGFPVLSPVGLGKYANKSVIFASIFHIAFLIIAFFANRLNIITLSYLTLISEFIILLYRFLVIILNLSKFKNGGEQ